MKGGQHQTTIACKWSNVESFDGQYGRMDIGSDIAPGETKDITISITAPTDPGNYDLQFNFIKRECLWFNGENTVPLFSKSIMVYPRPSVTTTSLPLGCLDGSTQVTLVAKDEGGTQYFYDGFENGLGNWTATQENSNYKWQTGVGSWGNYGVTTTHSGSNNVWAGSSTESYCYLKLNKDLSTFTNKKISFWYANPEYSSNGYDEFRLQYSTDGSSWTDLWSDAVNTNHDSWTNSGGITIPDNAKYIRFKGQSYDMAGVCIDDVTLTYLVSPSFSWSTGGSGSTCNVTPSAASNTYTVTNTTSGCSSSMTLVVPTVNNYISASANPSTVSCGNSVTLTASGSGTNLVYNWYSNQSCSNLLKGNSATYTPTPTDNTTYYVRSTVTIDGIAGLQQMGNPSNFEYTGEVKSVTVPSDAEYAKLEVWGAQGGQGRGNGEWKSQGGKGGYSTAIVNVTPGETFYIAVGGRGADGTKGQGTPTTTAAGGFNGGGGGSCDDDTSDSGFEASGGGGGATHIATATGVLSSLSGNREAILVVAGGGGGGSWSQTGGYGGGTIGGTGADNSGVGGTQDSGFAFGLGATATEGGASNGCGGGGGGWYGGQKNTNNADTNAGGGGSGHVTENNIYGETLAGNTSFKAPDGSAETGHPGNGYARITFYKSGLTCPSVVKSVSVTVNNKPQISITNPAAGTEQCAGTQVTLTGGSNQANTSYTWVGGCTQDGKLTVSSNGTYAISGDNQTYTVTCTGNRSGCTGTATATVSFKPSINRSLISSGEKTVCYGAASSNITISGSEASGTTPSYKWQRNGSDISSATNKDYTITGISQLAVGDYVYTRMVKDQCNDYAASTNSFTLHVVAPSISVSPTTATICNGNSAQLDASSTAGSPTFNWYDNSSCTGTPLHTGATYSPSPTADKTYYVKSSASYHQDSIFSVDFAYTGNVQSLTIPSGVDSAKLEVWGAQGGRSIANGVYMNTGGKGGYSTAKIKVTSGQTLYVVVGGKGEDAKMSYTSFATNVQGGYNGGGGGSADGSNYESNNTNEAAGAGGGATHIATATGLLSTLSGNTGAIIVVAGGGGGGAFEQNGGCGGGTTGGQGAGTNPEYLGGVGGSQTAGYAFGQGEPGSGRGNGNGVAGGGGGYYGGKINTDNVNANGDHNSAGGGSGYVITGGTTTAGSETFKAPDGSNETGHSGNGYARITFYRRSTGACASATAKSATVTVNTPNVAITDFAAQTICEGSSYTFNPSATGTGLTYQWKRDNTAIGTATTASFEASAAGTYYVTVKSTVGTCTAEDNTSATLTVKQKVTPTFNSITSSICNGTEFTLPTSSSNTSNLTGNVISGSWSPALSYTEGKTYTFTPNSNQCANTAQQTVTINTPSITNASNYDYIWRGGAAGAANDWNTASNWYAYDNGYSVASELPSSAKSYYIGSSSDNCINNATVSDMPNSVNVQNLTIDNNAQLTVPSGKTLNIAGNLTNTGTLTATSGTVVFNGSNNQTISNAVTFGDVTFAQTAVKSINATNGITVNGMATFTKGIVNGNMSFASTATATGASQNSFVTGTVSKTGTGASFTFPTGARSSDDASAMNVLGTASFNVPNTKTVSVKYNNAATRATEVDGEDHYGFNESDGYPRSWNPNDMCSEGNSGGEAFSSVSNFEFWSVLTPADLTEVTFHSEASDKKAHFSKAPVQGEGLNDLVKIAMYTDCGWLNAGGTTSVSEDRKEITISGISISANVSGAKSTRASNPITTFGSLDTPTAPLPIELISFTAECNNSSADIYWTTASEKNNEYFALERSADAVNFTEVARIAGAGNTIDAIDYSYTDYDLFNGNTYYRLWQVDFDGTRNASEIISVNCVDEVFGEPTVVAFPNPFQNDITLRLENFGNKPVTIEVYDVVGKLIYTEKIASVRNDYEQQLHFGNLAPSTYNIRVSTDEYVVVKQIVKN